MSDQPTDRQPPSGRPGPGPARKGAAHARRSRAALAGLTSVLFVGGVAALAEQDPANRVAPPPTSLAVDPASLAPPTTVVVERVARTIYLDRNGNVVAPPAGTDPAAIASAAAGAPAGPAAPGSAAPAVRPQGPAAPGASPTAPAPTPKGALPAPTANPTAPAPVPPPTTPPATTPVPPPPTVPPCTGSKCP